MKMFWSNWRKRRKAKKNIIRRAQAKQRAFDDKFYTAEMEQQRKTFVEAIKRAEENCEKEYALKEKALKKEYEEKNLELKLRVVEMDQKVRDAQAAWLIYKDWLPEALNSATAIRSGMFLKQQEITRSMGIVHGGEDKLELLQKQMVEKTEKIEKLLHFEVRE